MGTVACQIFFKRKPFGDETPGRISGGRDLQPWEHLRLPKSCILTLAPEYRQASYRWWPAEGVTDPPFFQHRLGPRKGLKAV